MGTWALDVNVAGVDPGGIGSRKIPRGVYLVETSNTTMQANSLLIEFKVLDDGPAKGMEDGIAIGKDQTKDGNKRNMRTMLQSYFEGRGITDMSPLETGIALKDTHFVNPETGFKAKFTVFIDPGEKLANGEWSRDQHRFILKADYDKYKANPALLPAKAPAESAADAAGGTLATPKSSKKKDATPIAAADPFATAPAAAAAPAAAPPPSAAAVPAAAPKKDVAANPFN